jgi:DNA polymerase III delta subunit
VRQAAFTKAGEFSSEPPQIIASENYESGQLADMVGGVSLFGGSQVTVIDTPAEELAEELEGLLPALAESSDTFVVIEGALLAPAKKRYQKHTDELYGFIAEKTERFNTFSLVDPLAQKDKKGLWLRYQQALAAGISPEEIIGVLWWQLKAIRLAGLTNSACEAGMKDFPYRKAKQALQTVPLEKAEELSRSLLRIYHQGHGGEVDLPTALEQWILKL